MDGIVIKKSILENEDILLEFVNEIGETLTQLDAEIIISDLLSYELINQKEAKLIKVATNDAVLKLEKPTKDEVRARILKNMLININ